MGADGNPILNDDGDPVYETKTITMAEYIRDHVIAGIHNREQTQTTLKEINNILGSFDASDPAALQAIIDDPDQSGIAITVTGEDGEPVSTTIGDYIKGILEDRADYYSARVEGSIIKDKLQAAWIRDHEGKRTIIRVHDEFSYDSGNVPSALTSYAKATEAIQAAEAARQWLRDNPYDGSNKTNRAARRARKTIEAAEKAQRFLNGLSPEIKAFAEQTLRDRPGTHHGSVWMGFVGRLLVAGTLSEYTLNNLRESIAEGPGRPAGDNGNWQSTVDTNTGKLIWKWNEHSDDEKPYNAYDADNPSTTVSTDSNGNTHVRTDDGSVSYDSDGNVSMAVDDEGREIPIPEGTPATLTRALSAVDTERWRGGPER